MTFINIDAIYETCSHFDVTNFYLEIEISKSKLTNARESLKIPADERVVAFLDTTVFGTGKYGMAIAASGVYWRNDWLTRTKRNFWSWEEFSGVRIEKVDNLNILLGEENCFYTGLFEGAALVEMLQQIQVALSTGNSNSEVGNLDVSLNSTVPSLPPQDNNWMVVIAGQRYGPYDMNTLESMVKSGQILPENTYVSSWVPFTQHPDLAAITRNNMAPPLEEPSAPSASEGRHSANDSAKTAMNDTAAESETRYVDINTASYDELVEITGVGAVGAKRIMQEREAIGGFQTPEQVGQLLGLKPHQVEKLRKLARFTPIPNKQNKQRIVDY